MACVPLPSTTGNSIDSERQMENKKIISNNVMNWKIARFSFFHFSYVSMQKQVAQTIYQVRRLTSTDQFRFGPSINLVVYFFCQQIVYCCAKCSIDRLPVLLSSSSSSPSPSSTADVHMCSTVLRNRLTVDEKKNQQTDETQKGRERKKHRKLNLINVRTHTAIDSHAQNYLFELSLVGVGDGGLWCIRSTTAFLFHSFSRIPALAFATISLLLLLLCSSFGSDYGIRPNAFFVFGFYFWLVRVCVNRLFAHSACS